MAFGLLLPLRIAQGIFAVIVVGLSGYGSPTSLKLESMALANSDDSRPLVRRRHPDRIALPNQLPNLPPYLLFPFTRLLGNYAALLLQR